MSALSSRYERCGPCRACSRIDTPHVTRPFGQCRRHPVSQGTPPSGPARPLKALKDRRPPAQRGRWGVHRGGHRVGGGVGAERPAASNTELAQSRHKWAQTRTQAVLALCSGTPTPLRPHQISPPGGRGATEGVSTLQHPPPPPGRGWTNPRCWRCQSRTTLAVDQDCLYVKLQYSAFHYRGGICAARAPRTTFTAGLPGMGWLLPHHQIPLANPWVQDLCKHPSVLPYPLPPLLPTQVKIHRGPWEQPPP